MSAIIEPLTAKAFAPFGDVIEADDSNQHFEINYGLTTRFHNLAQLDTATNKGSTAVSIFRSTPMPMPLQLSIMERHPLSSQCFFPLSDNPYLVVVAPAGEFQLNAIKLFLASSHQGVNYRAGTWHHFSLALFNESDFIVIDRIGPGDNCDEIELNKPIEILQHDLPITCL